MARIPYRHAATQHTATNRSQLPRPRELLTFPAVTFTLLVALVLLGVTGESTGMWWSLISSGPDPHLLWGHPRAITSDMWQVQASWVESQIANGAPRLSPSLPGGMDMTVQNDLQVRDWSSVFRPHTWLLLTGHLAQGMAWRWWLPGWAALCSVWSFVRSFVPSRRGAAWVVPWIVVLSPLVQWWYRPTTLWPIAMCFTGLTAVVWSTRSSRRRGPWAWAVLTGYVSVTTAMSIYVPYIVPCALVMVVTALGIVMVEMRGAGVRRAAGSLVPLLVSALCAGLVMAAWLATRLGTIRAVLDTVYPGHRLTSTGSCTLSVGQCVATLAGFWSRVAAEPTGTPSMTSMGGNVLEASTGLLLTLILVVPLLVQVFQSVHERRPDWTAGAVLVSLATLLAFAWVPHWDALAHLLFLDRTMVARSRLGLVILDPIAIVALLRSPIRGRGWRLFSAFSSMAMAAAMYVGVHHLLPRFTEATFYTGRWGALAIAVVVGTGTALIALDRHRAGVGLILIAAVAAGGQINPLYRGYTDLATTPLGRAITSYSATAPDGRWLAVTGDDGYLENSAMADVLLAAGRTSYNGVQTYPPRVMWTAIDPEGRYENEWNRLANVSWTAGHGAPVVSNPAQDQISVTFDSCASFAQANVSFVVSGTPLDQACLSDEQAVTSGTETSYLYKVVPSHGG